MNQPIGNTVLYKINITPQTHVRATQGDRIFFRIPREKLQASGLARLMRLERYNKYKVDLLTLCRVKGFNLPSQGLCVRFFIPMPKTWKKWERDVMNGKLHRQRPDIDNLLKAVLDSLLAEDKGIGHLGEISKVWTSNEFGWIEFEVKDAPYEEAITGKSRKRYIMGF